MPSIISISTIRIHTHSHACHVATGVRVTDKIMTLVPTMATLKFAIRALKLWAKRRYYTTRMSKMIKHGDRVIRIGSNNTRLTFSDEV